MVAVWPLYGLAALAGVRVPAWARAITVALFVAVFVAAVRKHDAEHREFARTVLRLEAYSHALHSAFEAAGLPWPESCRDPVVRPLHARRNLAPG